MKLQMLLSISMPRLLLLLFVLVAPLLAGPGEKGRPKILPTFETWPNQPEDDPFGDLGTAASLGDLIFHDLDGSAQELKKLWDKKPVLIVHSSMTCPVSRDNCPHVDRIKTDYGDQIDVVVLYTTEAHPVGSPSPYSEGGNQEWLTDRNLLEKVIVDEPRTIKERLQRAREYRSKQDIKSRLIVDNMDNQIWKAFGGGPNSGIFIERNGAVFERQGWLRPSRMAGAIRSHLAGLERRRVRDDLEAHGHKVDEGSPKLAQITKAAKDVPDVLSYNLNTKRASNDETFLHLAVKYPKPQVVDQLLKLGSRIDGLDRDGLTRLHYALRNQDESDEPINKQIIEKLLKHKASLTLRSDKLESSTHFAVQSGNLERLKYILNAGAPLDRFSIDGISPLHEALFRNERDLAAHLIKRGASVDIFASAALGNIKNLKRFLVHKPLAWNSYQGHSGRSPLIYAAAAGQTQTVEFLLSLQTPINRYANEQLIACLRECNNYKQTSSSLLIAEQARPLTGDNAPPPTQSLHPMAPPLRGWASLLENPLIHDVAEANQAELLQKLLERGWDVDSLSPDHETPLHRAAIGGARDSIFTLLEGGANLNRKSGTPRALPCGPGGEEPRRETPLHLAVSYKHLNCVTALVSNGANVGLHDNEGKTPLCHAFPDRYLDSTRHDQLKTLKAIVITLINAGADPDKPADCGLSFHDLAAKEIEHHKRVDGEWISAGMKPRSLELLRLSKSLRK
jgi:ankyrin repeat protein